MSVLKRVVIILMLLGAVSCKKKKDDAPDQPPSTGGGPPAGANTMSANINGKAWTVTGNQTSPASISIGTLNTTPKTYVVTGKTQSLSKNSIYIGFTYTTGVVSLETLSNFYAAYDDSTGTGYFAKTGTLNITVFDTSHKKSPVCDKLKATFSFTTTPIGSSNFTVTSGVIDFTPN